MEGGQAHVLWLTGERYGCVSWGPLLVEWQLAVDENGYRSRSGHTPGRNNGYFWGWRVGWLNDRLGSEVTLGRRCYPYGQGEDTVPGQRVYSLSSPP